MPQQTMSMHDLEQLHKKKWKRANWFAPQAMKFFKTRLESHAVISDGKAYFITSELAPYANARKYTVRYCNLETGKIETIGEFNSLTKLKAQRLFDQITGVNNHG